MAKKNKTTLWDKQRAERMAIVQDMKNPNEPWYQLLLDLAKDCSPPGTDTDEIQNKVDALLALNGARIVKDDSHPGGTRIDGYTTDIHAAVASALVETPTPAAHSKPEPEPAPADEPVEDLCFGCGQPESQCACDDPKAASGASEVDAGTVSESSKETTAEPCACVDTCDLECDCDCHGKYFFNDEYCYECGAQAEFENEAGRLFCRHHFFDGKYDHQVTNVGAGDLKERSHEPEVLDGDCDEPHQSGVPCLMCDWTGGELAKAATLEDVYKARQMIIDAESGELLPLDACFQVAQMQPAEGAQFQIVDDATAEWYIGLIRHLQNSIVEAGTQYAAMVGQILGALKALDYKYGYPLAVWAETKLQRRKSGALVRKSHRTFRGGVFFTKTGGARITNWGALRKFIDELPDDQLAFYGVKNVRKPSADRIKQLVEQGYQIPGTANEPAHELGTVAIGGERRWSFNAEKTRITKAINKLELRTVSELSASDEGGDDEHIDE